ncbi:MAG: tetratricopeptide repeat protein [Lentimicrobiaceae bacterium]|jgi:tetratricopeptide (TPR) repeat protein|nr:tetratricopeptide repeat protein [Lentimicrobiaceae bacterium]
MIRNQIHKYLFVFLFSIAFPNVSGQSEKTVQSEVVIEKNNSEQKDEIACKRDSIKLFRESDIVKALKLSREAYQIATETRKDSLKAYIVQEEGRLYTILHDYIEAHKKFTEAKILFQKYRDYNGLADVYADIGQLSFLDGNFDEALDFFVRANTILVEIADDKTLASNQMKLADMFFLKQDYARALDFYLSAQTIWEQEKLPSRQADALLGMAKVFRQTDHLTDAQNNFEEAENLYRQENALLPLARLQIAYAEMLFQVNKNATKALEKLKESEITLLEQQQTTDLIENYHIQQAIYKQKELYKEALIVSEKRNLLQNDSWNQRKQQIFSELQTRFRTKELEEMIVNQQIQLQEASRRLLLIKITSGVLIVTLIVLLIYIVQRKKKPL